MDQLFAALGDGTRRGIVAMLSDGRERAVGDLAAPFRMTLPAVTKHLRVLEDAEVVTSEKRGRVRWCRLRPQRMQPAIAWIEYHRRFWEQRFDELEVFLEETAPAAPGEPAAPPPSPSAHPSAPDQPSAPSSAIPHQPR